MLTATRAQPRTLEAGTAFFVSQGGLILTADHLIVGDDKVVHQAFRVTSLGSGREDSEQHSARLIRRFSGDSPPRDLALLRLEPPPSSTVPYLEIVDREGKVGEPVPIAGHPVIFSQLWRWPLLRHGHVASTRFNFEGREKGEPGAAMTILDIPSIAGFSGSPIVAGRDCRVVGVVTAHPKKGRASSEFAVGTPVTPADLAP